MNYVNLYDIYIFNDTLNYFLSCLESKSEKGFVVTPNVDHIVKLVKDKEFKKAYKNAIFVLPDGIPLLWASRVIGCPIKERIAGSDLFYRLLSFCEESQKSIYLLGSKDQVRKKALLQLVDEYPALKISGSWSPPFGFENNASLNDQIVGSINNVKPDFLFIFLGAPKQEKWINMHIQRLNVNLAFCLGASLDFYVGEFKRAPFWMQRMGFEWFWRMMYDRRLVKRYLIDDLIPFIWLTLREYLSARSCQSQCNERIQKND